MEFTIKNGKLAAASVENLEALNAFLGCLETASDEKTFASKFSQIVAAVREKSLSTVTIRIESFCRPSNTGLEGKTIGGSPVHEFTITGN